MMKPNFQASFLRISPMRVKSILCCVTASLFISGCVATSEPAKEKAAPAVTAKAEPAKPDYSMYQSDIQDMYLVGYFVTYNDLCVQKGSSLEQADKTQMLLAKIGANPEFQKGYNLNRDALNFTNTMVLKECRKASNIVSAAHIMYAN
jgi:hypothetical protein